MSFHTNMLAHLRAIHECLPRLGAKAEFCFENFQLEIKAHGRYYVFVPQYSVVGREKKQFTSELSERVTHFNGWRHYFNRRWKLSDDKLAFKQYCESHGLVAPRKFETGAEVNVDVIMKRTRSSFCEGIHGPFRPHQVRVMSPLLAEGEYFEEFVHGHIAKIWYLEDKVVALEVKPMVEVQGDGKKTLRELVSMIKSQFFTVNWAQIEVVARYQGVPSLDVVIADGMTVLVDFRYLSGLHPLDFSNQNMLNTYHDTPVMEQLMAAGAVFWRGIPEDLRRQTLYTVDAIVAPDQVVWFLEMNANPIVHPDAYGPMLASLFEDAAAEWNPPVIPVFHRREEPQPHIAPDTAGFAGASLAISRQQRIALRADAIPATAFYTYMTGSRMEFDKEELLALARHDMEQGRLEAALLKLKEVVRQEAVPAAAFAMIAKLYAQLRLFDYAKDMYERYLEIDPNSGEIAFELGMVNFDMGNSDEALAVWSELLRAIPTYPPALFYSALALSGRCRFGEAKRHLDVLLQSAEADNLYLGKGKDLLRSIEAQAIQQSTGTTPSLM